MNENKKDLSWIGPTIGAAGGLLTVIIGFFTPLVQTLIIEMHEKNKAKRAAKKAQKAQKVEVEKVEVETVKK